MKETALLLICAGNLCYAAHAKHVLGKAIKATRDEIVLVVTGKVREVGPIEAQTQALAKQATGRRAQRANRPAPLNL